MSALLRSGLTALVAALVLAAAGCGADDSAGEDQQAAPSATTEPTPAQDEPAEDPAEEPAPEPQEDPGTTIEITFEGGTVEPSGVGRKVAAGEPVTFRIVADVPGELHVHSSPEQEISYPAGRSEHRVVIEQPGLVEVESHDPDRLVVRLEVR